MTAIHVRRWQRPKADEDAPDGAELVFGPFSGTISDLTLYEEPADDGLVDVHSQPLRREPPARKPFGFHVRGQCE